MSETLLLKEKMNAQAQKNVGKSRRRPARTKEQREAGWVGCQGWGVNPECAAWHSKGNDFCESCQEIVVDCVDPDTAEVKKAVINTIPPRPEGPPDGYPDKCPGWPERHNADFGRCLGWAKEGEFCRNCTAILEENTPPRPPVKPSSPFTSKCPGWKANWGHPPSLDGGPCQAWKKPSWQFCQNCQRREKGRAENSLLCSVGPRKGGSSRCQESISREENPLAIPPWDRSKYASGFVCPACAQTLRKRGVLIVEARACGGCGKWTTGYRLCRRCHKAIKKGSNTLSPKKPPSEVSLDHGRYCKRLLIFLFRNREVTASEAKEKAKSALAKAGEAYIAGDYGKSRILATEAVAKVAKETLPSKLKYVKYLRRRARRDLGRPIDGDVDEAIAKLTETLEKGNFFEAAKLARFSLTALYAIVRKAEKRVKAKKVRGEAAAEKGLEEACAAAQAEIWAPALALVNSSPKQRGKDNGGEKDEALKRLRSVRKRPRRRKTRKAADRAAIEESLEEGIDITVSL